jgi:hypothetical protein
MSRSMRKKAATKARHEAARAWIESGPKKVHVRTYARRFGVNRYTAYQDLRAIGFPLTPEEERWAIRPAKTPKRRKPAHDPDEGLFRWEEDAGGRLIWVMGYTSGGAPYGLTKDECDMLCDVDFVEGFLEDDDRATIWRGNDHRP